MVDNSGAEERFEEPLGDPPVATAPWVRWLVASGAGAGLLGALLLALGWAQAGALLLVLGAVAVAGGALGRPRRSAPRGPRRGLVLRGRELYFDDASGNDLRPVASLGERFGVTVLANRARSRAALALTSSEMAFYVGASVSDEEAPRCRSMLMSAFTVASDERALEPAAPDGMPLLLGGEELARLYAGLLRVDGSSAGRFFLTDVRGDAVTLDHKALTVGPRQLDLGASLDWHGLLFQEAGNNGMTIYQGTHVRQGSTEVVFVSLMPALSSPADPGDLPPSDAMLEGSIQRDLTLLRDISSDPPPVSQRVAIDRVFMLPLRAALQAAPRSQRQRSSSPPV